MPTQTSLVTGANRGIGLEFTRQLKQRGERLIVTARDPDAAGELRALLDQGDRIEPLDVADPGSAARLGNQLGGERIDVLINNAGVGGKGQKLEETDTENILRVLDVNSVGPMRVTRALLPQLRAGGRKLIVNVSSQLGSITNAKGGSSYAYRSSKAALNMLTRHLAVELGAEGFTCVTIHPGWVQTDMGGPQAHLTTAQSVSSILTSIIDAAERDSHNGTFRNYDGSELPW